MAGQDRIDCILAYLLSRSASRSDSLREKCTFSVGQHLSGSGADLKSTAWDYWRTLLWRRQQLRAAEEQLAAVACLHIALADRLASIVAVVDSIAAKGPGKWEQSEWEDSVA